MGQAIDAEHLSELTEEELEVGFRAASVARLRGFARIDVKYLMPIFTRRFTPQVRHFDDATQRRSGIFPSPAVFPLGIACLIEFLTECMKDILFRDSGFDSSQDVYDGTKQMSALTDQWYRTVRPSDTESTTDERSTTESV